jgi:hypothetical protein
VIKNIAALTLGQFITIDVKENELNAKTPCSAIFHRVQSNEIEARDNNWGHSVVSIYENRVTD